MWLEHGTNNENNSWSTELNVIFHAIPSKAKGADQIISWNLATGSNIISFPNNGKSIQWQLGQPLTMQLQWANSSAYMPFVNNTEVRTIDFSNTNVIYKTKGQWGILEWLNRYSNNVLRQQEGKVLSEQVLTFDIPVSLKTKRPQDRRVAYTSLPNILISSDFIGNDGVSKPLIWPIDLPKQAPGINE
jgi:type VI secretion system protein ImpL